MKTQIIFALAFLLVITLLSMSSVSAIQYLQQKELRSDNVTTRIHATIVGDDGLSDDFVKTGNRYQFYIKYFTYIESWNTENPTNRVSYCNLTVELDPALSASQTLTTIRFDTDMIEQKYFVTFTDTEHDQLITNMDCLFQNASSRPDGLELPADFSIVSPSWECKECQAFEWAETEIKINKTSSLNSYNVDNIDFIRKLFVLHFEFIIIVFWIFLIIALLSAVGLLFVGMFWFYIFIKGLGKRI